jgi:hypothetical protein
METVRGLIWLTGAYPLWRAWQANRQTSLSASVYWAVISWAVWGLALVVMERWPTPATIAGHYLALSITGCAGVAVLGARRPIVGPWNFVVLALLAVDLLPFAEGIVTGVPLQLDGLRITCVSATLAVGILNYLPTRFAPAALLVLFASGFEMAALAVSPSPDQRAAWLQIGSYLMVWVPWIAFWSRPSTEPLASRFDAIWLDFRNRFGLVWAQRLRDQFNRSAAHAGWPVVLRWQGLRLVQGKGLPDAEMQSAMVATLGALLKRFQLSANGTGPESCQF